MEKNIKIRTLVAYNDIKENMKYYPSNDIRYLDVQRARELYQKGIITIMEIRKCKYE